MIGKSGGVERGPETIAWAREVMAHRGRVESGVDAAKEHAQVRSDHIADRLLSGREELFLCRFPGLRHE